MGEDTCTHCGLLMACDHVWGEKVHDPSWDDLHAPGMGERWDQRNCTLCPAVTMSLNYELTGIPLSDDVDQLVGYVWRNASVDGWLFTTDPHLPAPHSMPWDFLTDRWDEDTLRRVLAIGKAVAGA